MEANTYSDNADVNNVCNASTIDSTYPTSLSNDAESSFYSDKLIGLTSPTDPVATELELVEPLKSLKRRYQELVPWKSNSLEMLFDAETKNGTELLTGRTKIISSKDYRGLKIIVGDVMIKVKFSAGLTTVCRHTFSPIDLIDRIDSSKLPPPCKYGSYASGHRLEIEGSSIVDFPLRIVSTEKYAGMTCAFAAFVYKCVPIGIWDSSISLFRPLGVNNTNNSSIAPIYLPTSVFARDAETDQNYNPVPSLTKRLKRGLGKHCVALFPNQRVDPTSQVLSAAPESISTVPVQTFQVAKKDVKDGKAAPVLPTTTTVISASGSTTSSFPQWKYINDLNGVQSQVVIPIAAANDLEKLYQNPKFSGGQTTLGGQRYVVNLRLTKVGKSGEMTIASASNGKIGKVYVLTRSLISVADLQLQTSEDAKSKFYPPLMNQFPCTIKQWLSSTCTPFFFPLHPETVIYKQVVEQLTTDFVRSTSTTNITTATSTSSNDATITTTAALSTSVISPPRVLTVEAFINPAIWNNYKAFETQTIRREQQRRDHKIVANTTTSSTTTSSGNNENIGSVWIDRRRLYHGTTALAAEKILGTGFVHEFAPKRQQGGPGNYFSTDPAYSLHPAFATPDGTTGNKTLIVADVIVGRKCLVGQSDHPTLGALISSALTSIPGDRVESFVTNLANPTTIICPSNYQSYPLFKITVAP